MYPGDTWGLPIVGNKTWNSKEKKTIFRGRESYAMRRQWETEDLIDQWTLHAEDRAFLICDGESLL